MKYLINITKLKRFWNIHFIRRSCSISFKIDENAEPIKDITIDDIKIEPLFDSDGYHCDSELTNFNHDGNGCYEITIKNLGRSDKCV